MYKGKSKDIAWRLGIYNRYDWEDLPYNHSVWISDPELRSIGKTCEFRSLFIRLATMRKHHVQIKGFRLSPLRWRHNERDSVSNHQPHDCLLNRLFRPDQRNHQSSASLAFVWGIHRGPVNSPHKWPVTRKVFPFDDVIMLPIYQLIS